MGGYVIKPKYSFLETRKKSLTIGVMIFAAFISVVFMTYMAFGASIEEQDPNCSVWDWNAKCALSPILVLVLPPFVK